MSETQMSVEASFDSDGIFRGKAVIVCFVNGVFNPGLDSYCVPNTQLTHSLYVNTWDYTHTQKIGSCIKYTRQGTHIFYSLFSQVNYRSEIPGSQDGDYDDHHFVGRDAMWSCV